MKLTYIFAINLQYSLFSKEKKSIIVPNSSISSFGINLNFTFIKIDLLSKLSFFYFFQTFIMLSLQTVPNFIFKSLV